MPVSEGIYPGGSTYTVNKQYVTLLDGDSNMTDSSTDSGMIRVTITVDWPSSRFDHRLRIPVSESTG